jgi:hypothetical protein
VVLVLDATTGPTRQDKHIASLILKYRRGCVILVNKWDLQEQTQRQYEITLLTELQFMDYCPIVYASAKSGYNVRQSFELGARFRSVGGDQGTYRATVNYGNGLRLLSSSLSVQSVEGHGSAFDQIQLNTQGLGTDPYQNASLRVEKNRLYRYDLSWRSNAYYNPGLRSDHGQHFADTVRNYQDHDLTLFPQSSLKFFLGYSNPGVGNQKL